MVVFKESSLGLVAAASQHAEGSRVSVTTITISRELGSQGTQIAREVGTRLGFGVVWREVINEAARRAGAPEMALAAIDYLGLFDLHPSEELCRQYRQAVQEVLEGLAAEGDMVIVGRAGQVVLAGRPDVLHVRIIAPPEVRVKRIAALQDIPKAAARAQMEQSDRTRREYVQCTHDVDWNNPELYDLVLNTERMTVASSADLICRSLTECINQRGDH